jgi:hypothetical protein
MEMIEVEPVSFIGVVGGELLKATLIDAALRHPHQREFLREVRFNLLPAIAALLDKRVGEDFMRAAKEIYRRRGDHAKSEPQRERQEVARTEIGTNDAVTTRSLAGNHSTARRL